MTNPCKSVAAVLLLASCFIGVACTTTAPDVDGGSDGAPADDGAAADAPVDVECMLSYLHAGCDAAPVCLYGPQDACAGSFCGCDNKSFVGGCGFAAEPFASFGLCDGDVGDARAD